MTLASNILVFALGLCWGSFLNVLAYSFLHSRDWISRRSACPNCNKQIAWYDLIPVLSWIVLRAQCRHCKSKISWLYPLIELASALSFTLLWVYSPQYILAYIPLISALLVTVRTDLESMLVFELATWRMVPVALLTSALGLLPISLVESLLGLALGYGVLWLTRHAFWLYSKKEGLGQGDLDLLALIGAYVGPVGVWSTLLIASITGSLISIIYLLATHQKNIRMVKVPFGPFLALGALISLLAHGYIEQLFLGF